VAKPLKISGSTRLMDLGSSCDAASQNPIGSAWPERKKRKK